MAHNCLSIAASDSISGAGLQADLKTFNNFGCHLFCVATAITAQNRHGVLDIEEVSADSLAAQIAAVTSDASIRVIKIGMLYSRHAISIVAELLHDHAATVICDPVVLSSSGTSMLADIELFKQAILPHVDILTPNLRELELLTGTDDMDAAISDLLHTGVKNIIAKGGHSDDKLYSSDYVVTAGNKFYLHNYRLNTSTYHGSGCVFAAAIGAAIAKGADILEACIHAKIYIHQAIRLSITDDSGNVVCSYPAYNYQDMPWISSLAYGYKFVFPKCPQLGLYPVVDSIAWIKKLLPLGIKTIQLRIKDKHANYIAQEIKQAVILCKQYKVRLFINDYWQLAIKYKAYGVHLGQEDLSDANLAQIHAARLFLGISNHSLYELARAHAISPSYIACGPVFHTQSKVMPWIPQGVDTCLLWSKLLPHYPLVAIGGINTANIKSLVQRGIKNIAVISAITKSKNYIQVVKKLMQATQN